MLRLQQAHEPSIAPSRNRSPIGTYSTQPRFILESTFIEPGDRNETGVIIARPRTISAVREPLAKVFPEGIEAIGRPAEVAGAHRPR